MISKTFEWCDQHCAWIHRDGPLRLALCFEDMRDLFFPRSKPYDPYNYNFRPPYRLIKIEVFTRKPRLMKRCRKLIFRSSAGVYDPVRWWQSDNNCNGCIGRDVEMFLSKNVPGYQHRTLYVRVTPVRTAKKSRK